MKQRSDYSGMISEDRSQNANLPKDVKEMDYPKNRFMDRYELDDTARGIDDQRNEAVAKIESEHSDSKW